MKCACVVVLLCCMLTHDITNAFFLNSNHIVRQQLALQQASNADRYRRGLSHQSVENDETHIIGIDDNNLMAAYRRCIFLGSVCFFVSK